MEIKIEDPWLSGLVKTLLLVLIIIGIVWLITTVISIGVGIWLLTDMSGFLEMIMSVNR